MCEHHVKCTWNMATNAGMMQALMWWTGKTVDSVFAAWVSAVRRGHTLRLCKARALFSYSNMLQRKAFHSWQDGITYRRARQEKMALVFEDMAGRRLCLAFDAWYAVLTEICRQTSTLS